MQDSSDKRDVDDGEQAGGVDEPKDDEEEGSDEEEEEEEEETVDPKEKFEEGRFLNTIFTRRAVTFGL